MTLWPISEIHCRLSPFELRFDVFYGRIAQLVERLSYTQVVIGSSPVAPIEYFFLFAGVVQLVRALPCHGRGCGFEPRLPRFFPLFKIPKSI